MLRSALLVLLTLTLAVGGGAASVWYAVAAREGVGAVRVGVWTSAADAGSPAPGPYARARLARDGLLALGRAEGLVFTADRDADGAVLRRECRYVVAGSLPPARLWTLHAADAGLAPLGDLAGRRASLNAFDTLYRADASISIAAAPRPAAGNWLPTGGQGPMVLVLTLYDTPATPDGSLALPGIKLDGCDG